MKTMSKYRIYELYNYTSVYDVEAESEEQAIEMMEDDPFEYRVYELEDETPNLVYRIAEKAVNNEEVIRSN